MINAMTEYQKALQKWKKEIGFDTLQFPLYKKSDHFGDFFRFDSVKTVITVRTKRSKGITVDNELPENLFVEFIHGYQTSTPEEFNTAYQLIKPDIENLIIYK